MATENVEIVRRCFEDFARRDLEAIVQRLAPDVEFDLSERLPDEGAPRGRDAVLEFWARTFEIWAEFRIEAEEIIDAGDAVVALVRTIGVGRGSGVEVTERVAHVAWFDDGSIVRWKVFVDPDRALASVGL